MNERLKRKVERFEAIYKIPKLDISIQKSELLIPSLHNNQVYERLLSLQRENKVLREGWYDLEACSRAKSVSITLSGWARNEYYINKEVF